MLQAPRSFRRRHLAIPRRQDPAVAAAPDRDRKTEPGDENNQDISSLVGKVDIRKLETSPRTIPTPTAIPAPQPRQPGHFEFVEMFKAPIKMLHPLLTAARKATISAPRISARSRSPASFSPTPTRPNGRPSRTTRLSSTVSASSRCRIPARHRRAEDLREADGALSWPARHVRAGAGNDGALLGLSRLRKHENSTCSPRCGSTTATA